MSRIEACFATLKEQQRKALIPYITAGDPTKAVTVPVMHAMVEAGADVIELGAVPYTHMTLPTSDLVSISAVAASRQKKDMQ